MKLTCPKCRAKSSVPDAQVPVNGAWARCPKCGERFFIQPLGQGWMDAPLQEAQAPAPKSRRRSPEAQKMLERLRSKSETEGRTSLTGPAYDPATITVFPQPESSQALTWVAAAVLAFMVGYVLVGSFNQGGKVRVASEEPTTILGVTAYGEKELRADLLALRRQSSGRPHLRRTVSYSGHESRVFKYFLAELAADECQEITRLDISADRSDNDFNAVALCLDDRRSIPTMRVLWEGRDAVVSFEGYSESRRFILFPQPGPTMAAGTAAQ